MERDTSSAESMLEQWRGDEHVRRAEAPYEASVDPNLVLEGLRPTVEKHGHDIGRVAFSNFFPGQEAHFDRFFKIGSKHNLKTKNR